MSRLTDLLRQLRSTDAQLGADLELEISALTNRRSFGLVFERHQPEAVDLPHQPIRRAAKVRLGPRRGGAIKVDQRLWRVESLEFQDGKQVARVIEDKGQDCEVTTVPVEDLVVVAEFEDKIYPGLVETGRVECGGDKPFHSIINSENFHALELLTYTHRGQIDVVYIDPPYNSGSRDWKYNNDYVESDDDYRHSKWLAFMERRLRVARELLNPTDSVLIVTIDEKEYLRLGLLLEQTFPDARIQMVTSVINPSGVARGKEFARVDEYLFFVMFGSSGPAHWEHNMLATERLERKAGTIWRSLQRAGTNPLRQDRPNMFYPVWVDPDLETIHSVGDPIPPDASRLDVVPPSSGLMPVWPIRANTSEGRWQIGHLALRRRLSEGTARLGSKSKARNTWAINYLREAELARIETGQLQVTGRDEQGALEVVWASETGAEDFTPATVWNVESHSAGSGGSNLLQAVLPGRKFPFPKSLYAVEDALRFFVGDKPEAKILDFFAGSGTTAHAVMRLNYQDSGRRQSISITNNEVSADEQVKLRTRGLRPGDDAWEQLGICDYITKPRIRAAITGKTPEGKPVDGDYKFTDEFPMADGFGENAAFFTLTYEAPLSVRHNRAFARIGPMLWMRAGSSGPIINDLGTCGWAVSDVYGVLENVDGANEFFNAVRGAALLRTVFVITEDEAAFQMMCRGLSVELDVVQLYESYIQNFEINQTRGF